MGVGADVQEVAVNPAKNENGSPTNTEGPAGTYGCACPSRDARTCVEMRYGSYGRTPIDPDEGCTCLCHQWDEDDEDAS